VKGEGIKEKVISIKGPVHSIQKIED